MRKIYLIDCPGVVPPSSNDDETSIVLKGVVRVGVVQECAAAFVRRRHSDIGETLVGEVPAGVALHAVGFSGEGEEATFLATCERAFVAVHPTVERCHR